MSHNSMIYLLIALFMICTASASLHNQQPSSAGSENMVAVLIPQELLDVGDNGDFRKMKRDYDFVRFGRSAPSKKASYDYIRFGRR